MLHKVYKYNKIWDIVERDSGFWVIDAAGPVAGGFGTMTEAAKWAAEHTPKEFETQSFYKKD